MKRTSSVLVALLLLARLASAATANVSTIAVAASTVTVTVAVPHGLAVNAGVCLSSPALCTVVETVPTSTTLTFTQPTETTVSACAASCGTVSTAPTVIVLGLDTRSNPSLQIVNARLWLTTTKPIPTPGATSAWATVNGLSVGASAAQTAALAAGRFIEVVANSVVFPKSLSAATIETVLATEQSDRQAAFVAGAQPGAYYGFQLDAGAWVQR